MLQQSALLTGAQMENLECILCGTCVDNCSKNVIRYSFSAKQ